MQKASYELEVLVNGKPLREYIHEHKVYIEGRKQTSFSLRLRNNTGERKLFVPTIDGLSVMNGKEGSFDSSGYVLEPNSGTIIKGWRTSDRQVAEFFFSSPDKSYGKKMQRGDNLGVIGVAVFSEKSKTPKITYGRIENHTTGVHHNRCYQYWCTTCGRNHWSCGSCPMTSQTVTYTYNTNTGPMNSSLTSTSGNYNLNALSSTPLQGSVPQSLYCSSAEPSANVSFTGATSRSHEPKQEIGTGFGLYMQSEVISVDFERKDAPDEILTIYYNTRAQLEALGVDLSRRVQYIAPQAFPGQYCEPPKN